MAPTDIPHLDVLPAGVAFASDSYFTAWFVRGCDRSTPVDRLAVCVASAVPSLLHPACLPHPDLERPSGVVHNPVGAVPAHGGVRDAAPTVRPDRDHRVDSDGAKSSRVVGVSLH